MVAILVINLIIVVIVKVMIAVYNNLKIVALIIMNIIKLLAIHVAIEREGFNNKAKKI